ncbi:membrane protein [Pseudoclavibacter endophyticus]|uniref:DedA family protein n=1 Tax=Pseudoclavibacter endophyticus TaxID=1778590 RepID=A0A6H9WGZ1_9MICO|nr:DedA family protein [Pseudoclavibacter endophyticus]KAB1646871.1 DedA family protein [Pseudoclavibacter endophyticus]GGA74841.1 membrane protein [Pseudoclavibacter endophyticus]
MLDDVLSTLLGVVRDMDPVLRVVIAGVAIMLETSVLLGLLVPGDTVVIIASTGIQGPVEWITMIVVVVVGALAGESVGFGIGRWFGPRIRTSWLGRKLGPKRIAAAQRYLKRRGGVGIFLSRFLPVLHSTVPLVAGMSGMRYRTFMLWTLPACLIWASAYVSVAAAASASYSELTGRLHGAAYVFVGIIVAFLLIAWLVKTLLGRHVHRAETARDGADARDASDGPGSGTAGAVPGADARSGGD